jgi:uncharacterized Zn finger protein
MANPICGHDDYNMIDSSRDEDDISYTMKCTECGVVWHECFEMKAVLIAVYDDDWKEVEVK